MAADSKIQWTDHTLNFWTGCKKVSAGCKYCYMYRDKERYGKDPTEVVPVSHNTIVSVLKKAKPGDKIFTCSWSDFFIEEADTWRRIAWNIIRAHPQFIWQILTKRPERMKECLPEDWGDGWPHVWLGVSVENQEQANIRIPTLLATPAALRWLSCEPLLGPVDLGNISIPDPNDTSVTAYIDSLAGKKVTWLFGDVIEKMPAIDWVVVGGESGNDKGKYLYRPCDMEWIAELLYQCFYHEVPGYMKQLGTHLAKVHKLKDRHGGDDSEWPHHFLQMRQFPDTKL